MFVHLRTYHPDYIAWIKPYRLAGLVLVLTSGGIALTGTYLKSTIFLLVAAATLLTVGIPLLITYRRKFAEFKQNWTQEHSLGISTLPSGLSTYKCEICGKELTIEKGIGYDRRAHYKSEHPDFYRWQQKQWIIAALLIVFLVGSVLFPYTQRLGADFLALFFGILVAILAMAVFLAWTVHQKIQTFKASSAPK